MEFPHLFNAAVSLHEVYLLYAHLCQRTCVPCIAKKNNQRYEGQHNERNARDGLQPCRVTDAVDKNH